ncbi:alpha/beta hydrolase [Aureivirga sp. CE67]|uniref:alpha/beta hydrolase n=1 Tax=Aureivirga sp. CE67 TaxID=1788983 RepID=UPI0018CADB56|nr:alpha/beta hydrolase [Aureivirga sp. CE67]
MKEPTPKEKLIILSDLWGKKKSEWIREYFDVLNKDYSIKFYDCCELGEIDTSDYREEKLHKQFIRGGIEKAVENLLLLEKEKINILAFSIGGTIAWKFGLKGGKINNLTCLSSTRLRKEEFRPKGNIFLYYGEKDNFQPSKEWLEIMSLKYQIVQTEKHEFYRDYARKLFDNVRVM